MWWWQCAAWAAPPPLAGDPLTVATGGVFAGPTGMLATPGRLARELPALSSGLGAREVAVTAGPTGFASGDAGDLRWVVAAAYAGQASTLSVDTPGVEAGAVDRTTDTTGVRTAELGLAFVSLRSNHTFVALSGRAAAAWEQLSLPRYSTVYGAIGLPVAGPASPSLSEQERGRLDGLDFEGNLDGNLAHTGAEGGWLLGASVSWLRSAGWIESKDGQFDEAGEFIYGTTRTGYDDLETLGYENRTGVWPGLRASFDRGATPRDFDWRVELWARGGRLVPTQPTHTVTEYAPGSRTEVQTTIMDSRGGAVETSLALWRGFTPENARVRVGAVASTRVERRTWIERSEGELPPFDDGTSLGIGLGDVGVDSRDTQVSIAAPVAFEAPLSVRTRLAAALTPGFRFTRSTEVADDGSGHEANVELPWLEADAGLSWRATGQLWVHGLLTSEPSWVAYFYGYEANANLPGSGGDLPLEVSLWITNEVL